MTESLSNWRVTTQSSPAKLIAVCEKNDARLIAAAPEMLEALESSVQFVLAWLPEYEDGPQRKRIEEQIEKTRAAINKAKGDTANE